MPFVDNLGDNSIIKLTNMIRDNILFITNVSNTRENDLEICIDVPNSFFYHQKLLLIKDRVQKIVLHIIKNRTKEWLDKDEFDQGKHPENYCTILKCLCNFQRE